MSSRGSSRAQCGATRELGSCHTGGDMERWYFVYILSSFKRVLYVGITNDTARRLAEHRVWRPKAFTARYGMVDLVYVEAFTDVRAAIAREKQIKSWRREKKIRLVLSQNPEWKDLSSEWEGPDTAPSRHEPSSLVAPARRARGARSGRHHARPTAPGTRAPASRGTPSPLPGSPPSPPPPPAAPLPPRAASPGRSPAIGSARAS
jgi:putative endonuclease